MGVRHTATRLDRDMPSQKMSIRKNRTTLASKLTAIVSLMSGPVVNLAHSNEKSSLIRPSAKHENHEGGDVAGGLRPVGVEGVLPRQPRRLHDPYGDAGQSHRPL